MLDDTAAAERATRWREERGVTDALVRFVQAVQAELGTDVRPVMLAQRLLQDRPDLTGMVLAIGMRVVVETGSEQKAH